MKRSRLRHALVWGIFPFAVCCASSKQNAMPTLTAAVREEFDPQTLNDDDFLLTPPSRSPAASQSASLPAPVGNSERADGYRIQIAAVLDRARAETLRAEAAGQLKTHVYIHYDEDMRLYKIQAGNARTPGQAENLRQEAKAGGFPEAYVVRASVEVASTGRPKPVRQATVSGFRVQIFSASSRQAADQAQTKARSLLGRQDVYVEFEPPFFKVRIGNFSARKEAGKFLDTVKEQGYQTSFLVQTQIRNAPE